MNEKLKLFSYAVLFHKKEIKDGKEEYIGADVIIEPKTATAKNDKDLLFKIIREVPANYAETPDRVEILIRPF